ncbi:MAG: hypothetical protein IT372_07335 [Polyangiaceae bacterium]|nr:hypothetical protein [Polyangiaceae bacterium]
MCGDGPHPGGPLFQRLCALADRFREVADDPAAARISSALSLLAVHAARSPEDDFRRRLGSILMDLAIEEERVRAAANPGGPVPYDRLLP